MSLAQQAINYKALIKDGSGNVMANQEVLVEFSILEGVANTLVYKESHTDQTDVNGIIILNIGAGSVISGNYNTINWGNDAHFLNVKIDSGSGLVDLGTTQFMAVPYALFAETSGSGGSSTGLEIIDEGNGNGWRLIGRDPNYFGLIGEDAVDLSFSNIVNGTFGATGEKSVSMGNLTTASGLFSTAIGSGTTASGSGSTSMGFGSMASGYNAFASGFNAIASASYATSIGFETEANQNYALAMGESTISSGISSVALGAETTALGNGSFSAGDSNTAAGNSSVALGFQTNVTHDYSFAMGNNVNVSSFSASALGYNLINDDTYSMVIGQNNDNTTTSSSLFIIGNGTSPTNRSNALTVLQNGKILAPSLDISEITDAKSLVTKEYLEGNYVETGSSEVPSGLEAIDEGNGFGWRLIGSSGIFGPIGSHATQLSETSFINQSGATGNYSFTTGRDVTASGLNSMATGLRTIALGNEAVAMGNYTQALGDHSLTSGYSTIANTDYSTVVGKFNDYSFSSFGGTLFKVGNGSSSTRSNALTVFDTGFVGLGTHFLGPDSDLHVFHGNDGALNGFKLQNKEGSNENWWRFYTLNSNGQLYLYSKAGGNNNAVGSFDDVSGAYTALSDRRVKNNFKDLYFKWQDFMKLKPLTYSYITDDNKKSNIGFVAQDVESIYPELVNYNKDNDLYQLNYSGFGVVAIKAIQVLKIENEQLKALLLKEEQANAEQSQLLQVLLERLENLEKQQSKPYQTQFAKN
ncbi:MAG: tail fiber domain-containing protein [Flavobacteriaceae bacterium]